MSLAPLVMKTGQPKTDQPSRVCPHLLCNHIYGFHPNDRSISNAPWARHGYNRCWKNFWNSRRPRQPFPWLHPARSSRSEDIFRPACASAHRLMSRFPSTPNWAERNSCQAPASCLARPDNREPICGHAHQTSLACCPAGPTAIANSRRAFLERGHLNISLCLCFAVYHPVDCSKKNNSRTRDCQHQDNR